MKFTKNTLIVFLLISFLSTISFNLRAESTFEDILEGNFQEKIKEEIAKNPDFIKKKDSQNRTLLHYAAQYNCEEEVQLLISSGADLNAKDNDGKTPLMYAANERNWEIVELLAYRGADLNAVNNKGQACLHYAVRTRSEYGSKLLIEKGATLDIKDKEKKTPLFLTVENGYRDIAKILIEAGADIYTRDMYERTLLHVIKNVKLAELLISKGLDLNARDFDGNTPLHSAGKEDRKNIAELFVYYGADVNIKNCYGQLPPYRPSKEDYKRQTLFPEMVLIKGGTFKMANPPGSDKSIKTVSSFYIGKYEVTIKEFRCYDPDYRLWHQEPHWDNFPAGAISWYDAVDYCNCLSLQAGLEPCYIIQEDKVEINITRNGYRLPTEAEWEYACRAGSTTKYYWGNDVDGKYLWYSGNSNFETHPVGQKKPNKFGLYDMSGNVYEWCNDLYYSDYPAEPGSYRVCRGGDYLNGADSSTSFFRLSVTPYETFDGLGLRIVRNY
ncbi:MAG TPA: SUMF1/EgtB/PvdO family nonheme iron enzyme [Candidatus Eremiobacteraeota bacterium]|nr:MAG: Serine/threonine-protein kinase pkn1 [bacterium ADurb.Bin363]HPZ10541.1 SUMF1/EgtB/PvdO family nonheme iron enzyme [Candidatus Eremiobacteraeota bacterium]